jgi:hypothetical protein
MHICLFRMMSFDAAYSQQPRSSREPTFRPLTFTLFCSSGSGYMYAIWYPKLTTFCDVTTCVCSMFGTALAVSPACPWASEVSNTHTPN